MNSLKKNRGNEAIGYEASYKKGLALLKAEQYTQAANTFNDLISKHPKDIMAPQSTA